MPEPYSARARFRSSYSCGVGVGAHDVVDAHGVVKSAAGSGNARQRAFVCCSRARAAAVSAAAIPGVAEATMLRTMARRLAGRKERQRNG